MGASADASREWISFLMTLAISLLLLAQTGDGIAQFRSGDYAAAVETLQRVEASPARDAFLGVALAATSRCTDALPLLSQPYAASDLSRLARLAATQCHLSSGSLGDAVSVVRQLEREFPNDPDVLYQAARVHMRGFNDAVARMFEAAPASYRVNQLSGEIFEREGKFAEAVREYRKAIEKNPKAVNLHYRAGRAILMESTSPENLSQAKTAFEAELALNPRDAVAEYQVGQILALQGNADGAMRHMEKAVALDPKFVEALVTLAKLDKNRSIELLERAIQLQPKNEPAHYALLIAYRNAGRTDDASRQKRELDKLQARPAGEFSDFLKKLGEQPAKP